MAAAKALGSLQKQGLEKPARSLAAHSSPQDTADRLVAAWLLRGHESKEAIELLTGLATDTEPAIAAAALERLVEHDFRAVLPLAEQLAASKDAHVRHWAAKAWVAERTPEAVDYLGWLLKAFEGYASAVELRHRSWSDAATDTTQLLGPRTAWVQIDEPRFDSSVRQDFSPGIAELYYVRFHGRNAREWWDHAESEDRYNYWYSEEELRPIADKVRDVRAMVKKAYLFLNNHFSAQAVANAVTLKHMLDQPIDRRMPPELVERFPDLAKIVSTLPRARLI